MSNINAALLAAGLNGFKAALDGGNLYYFAGTVPADVRKAVSDAMLKLHQDDTLYEVLVELGASQFVVANAAEYAGSERLLRGVFGYKPKAGAAAPAAQPAVEAAEEEEVTGGIEVTAGG